MEIDGKTRVCGLIGNPVEHTLSPVIHNNLADLTNDDLVYVPFHVPEGELGNAIKGAEALNLLGLNITVPYKSEVCEFLCDIDPLAKKIGAVNTLVRCQGGFKGYNTDMPGLYRAMKNDGVNIEGEDIIILGAGGVSRAVCMMLLEKGAKRIFVINRNLDRARKVCDEVNYYAKAENKVNENVDFATAVALDAYDTLDLTKKYIVIQATNVGMYPNVNDVVIDKEAFYKCVKVGYDLIFNPGTTKFMKLVKEHGGEAYNGLKMLLFQGIIAYEYWTNKKVFDEWAKDIYEKMSEKL